LLSPSFVIAKGDSSVLLVDDHFKSGVRVVAPEINNAVNFPIAGSRSQSVCLPRRDCSLQPVWQLQQWGSSHDIARADGNGPSWLLFDSASRILKSVQLSPADPILGDVTLEVNGLSEFSAMNHSAPRYISALGEPWPHLLLSQQLRSGRIAQYSQLKLRGEFKLLFDKHQRAEGYNPGLHAARLLLAMTVRSRLTGDYFWLTLPLYDDRYLQSDFGCQKCVEDGRCVTPRSLKDPGVWRCPEDKAGSQWQLNEKTGTARMIFRVPNRYFVQGDSRSAEWIRVDGDLMPYVLAGIDAVRQREGSQRFPADPLFYELGLFSIGWEVTGFNHVAAQLRDWQLEALQ
jgi:hypothetical protein